eukprot:jgi/Chrzof1/416/Cz01g15040.t1
MESTSPGSLQHRLQQLRPKVLTSFSTSSASPALEQEASTNRNIWGFVHTAVLHEHPPAASSADDAPDQITPYLAALQASHVFKSPHSAVAMAKTYGAADLLLGLSGSLLLPTSDSAAADQASDHIRQQINHAWSNEAVRRGVAAAKSGDYKEAHRCYDKALDMNPTNVDAYVARGAAHANQKQLLAAIKDFQHALDLDGQNVNAAKYLEATQQHLQQHDAKHQTRSSPDASNHNRQQPPSSRRHQHNHHAVQPAAAGVGSQHQVHVRDHVSAALKVPAAAADGSGRAANVKSKDDSARSGQQRSPTGTASPSSYDSSDASSANASEGPSKVPKPAAVSVTDVREALDVIRKAKGSSGKGSSVKSKHKKHKHKHRGKQKRKKHTR